MTEEEKKERKRERDRKRYAEHREEVLERKRKYRAEHREERNERRRKHHAEHPEERNEYNRKYNVDNPKKSTANSLYNAARGRAKQKGLPFTLTKEWIVVRIERGMCELSGLPFNLESGRGVQGAYSASIDRIVPELGYTPDNCRMILLTYNVFKMNGTDKDMHFFAEQLTRQHNFKPKMGTNNV